MSRKLNSFEVTTNKQLETKSSLPKGINNESQPFRFNKNVLDRE